MCVFFDVLNKDAFFISNLILSLVKYPESNSVIEWLFDKWSNGEPSLEKFPWSYATGFKAAKFGNLEILKWCFARKLPFHINSCEKAAAFGHLNVVSWIWDSFAHIRSLQLSFWPRICTIAATHGQVHVFKWLVEIGVECMPEAMSCAASNGHLEILMAGFELNCEWDTQIFAEAALHRHYDMLAILANTIDERNDTAGVTAALAAHDDLELLQWAVEQGFEINGDACLFASMRRNVRIVNWLHENRYPCEHIQ